MTKLFYVDQIPLCNSALGQALMRCDSLDEDVWRVIYLLLITLGVWVLSYWLVCWIIQWLYTRKKE